MSKLPHVPGRGRGRVHQGSVFGIALGGADKRHVGLGHGLSLGKGSKGFGEVVIRALGEAGVRETNADGLVNVQHVDVGVPRELIEGGAVGILVDEAGEVVGVVKRRRARPAGDVNGRRGSLGVVPGLCSAVSISVPVGPFFSRRLTKVPEEHVGVKSLASGLDIGQNLGGEFDIAAV